MTRCNIQCWRVNKEGIWDASIQGSFITGHSVGSGTPLMGVALMLASPTVMFYVVFLL